MLNVNITYKEARALIEKEANRSTFSTLYNYAAHECANFSGHGDARWLLSTGAMFHIQMRPGKRTKYMIGGYADDLSDVTKLLKEIRD